MPRKKNSYFNFKQFIIEQELCAMKVCTDACVLGAFVEVKNAKKILDIGTGTGLLALMMAQRTNARIDAVEIDESAYNQAVKNVQQSIFNTRIKVFNERIQDFLPKKEDLKTYDSTTYDLIISNPPFYQNSLQSTNNRANKALHAVELTFDELMESVARLLQKDGKFVVLLPPFETEQIKAVAAKLGFFVNHQLALQHDETKPIFRIITTFARTQLPDYQLFTLKIWNENGNDYTDQFRELLQDYYTIF